MISFLKQLPIKQKLYLLTIPLLFIGTATVVYLAQRPQDIRNYAAQTETTALPTQELSPLGEQKTLVVLINFQDDPDNKPFTKEEVYNAIFSDTGRSVNSYYRENSYNKTWLSGEVAGWYTLPFNSKPCLIAASSIDPIVKQNGIDVDSYPRKIYIFPNGSDCGVGSWGSTGGNPTEAFINGSIDFAHISHEFGHNITLGHANSITCGNKAIDILSNCTISYYGDGFGVMGHSWLGYHHNAFFKSWLGWIPANQVLEVKTSGIYKLSSIESENTGYQTLTIPKPDTLQKYSFEYRQPTGFDNTLPTAITQGTLIRIAELQPYVIDSITYQHPETFLIDNHPGSSMGFDDAALQDNQSFYDEINNIRVTQLSHSPESVTLQVEIDENKCFPELPSLLVSPNNQSGTPGQTLSYNVTLTNNDPLNCQSTTFSFSKSNNYSIPGWSYSFSPETVQITPGDSQTITYQVTSAQDAQEFMYPADIKVIDLINSYHSKTAKVSYSINLNSLTSTPIQSSPTLIISITPTQLLGDANGDNRVNILDFELLRQQFNQIGSNLTADFNSDNKVNLLDFEILRSNFGRSGN